MKPCDPCLLCSQVCSPLRVSFAKDLLYHPPLAPFRFLAVWPGGAWALRSELSFLCRFYYLDCVRGTLHGLRRFGHAFDFDIHEKILGRSKTAFKTIQL